jgi:hypothetical protein
VSPFSPVPEEVENITVELAECFLGNNMLVIVAYTYTIP